MKTKNLFGIALCFALSGNSIAQTLVTQVKSPQTKKWGYMNIKGEIIIPAQYDKCYEFSGDGYAAIIDSKTKDYNFINLKGETLPTEVNGFDLIHGMGVDLGGYSNGLVAIGINKKWGFLNTSGKIAIPAKYDEVSTFNSGLAMARNGALFYVLDTKGTETAVSAPGIIDLKSFSEKLAPYRDANKKLGFIDGTGKAVIPAQFESVGNFSAGLAWAKNDAGMLGYINTKGDWVIKPQFASGKNFDKTSGLARVKNGDKWCYVNKTGEISYVNDTEAWGDFSEGLAEGKKNGKTGFYDAKGTWIIPAQFDGTRDFKNGYAAAKVGDKWGIINKEGKWIIPPTNDGLKDMEAVN